jgi:hypothetical protein
MAIHITKPNIPSSNWMFGKNAKLIGRIENMIVAIAGDVVTKNEIAEVLREVLEKLKSER